VPFLRGGQVATALERAMHHGSRRLFLGYWLYLSAAENLWRDLHVLYGFASSAKLAGKAVDDAAMPGTTSAGHAYAHAVLLSLSNPYRFSQREQEQPEGQHGESAKDHAPKGKPCPPGGKSRVIAGFDPASGALVRSGA